MKITWTLIWKIFFWSSVVILGITVIVFVMDIFLKLLLILATLIVSVVVGCSDKMNVCNPEG